MCNSLWKTGIISLLCSFSFAVEPQTICQFGLNSISGLVGLFHINEGSGNYIYDTVVGSTGTLSASSTWVTGKISNCVYYDGINTGVPTNLTMPAGDFTYVFWVNFNAGSGIYAGIMGTVGDNRTFRNILGNIRLDLTHTGGQLYQTVDTVANVIGYDTWTHVAWVAKSNNWTQIYINSVLSYGPYALTGSPNSYDLILGYNFLVTDADRSMKGYIDEAAVFNRVLSAAEIEHIYYRNPRSQ